MANTEPWVGTWRPHRPRRPIAAMHQTPGPNKYLLPSLTGTSKHDPTKSKSPAFSMASRHLQSTVHHSPGPAHFVEPNTTRTGRHTAPGVSLKGKRQSQVKLAGPGPVQHLHSTTLVIHLCVPSLVTVAKRKAPSFSFGVHHSQYKTPLILNDDY
uniref:Uncharacterized protein n=1 Tax=Salarias fasciatus TaxID=181472 RepID=A0A672J5W4_SALFA